MESQFGTREATAGVSEAAARVRGLMERIAGVAGVPARIEVREEDETVYGEFVGEELGLLIGRHGQTIDAAGYRERRALALRAAADQAAEAAIHDGRSVALEPMSAIERKLVHEHLRTRRDVETYSQGEEPDRRLVVAPLV